MLIKLLRLNVPCTSGGYIRFNNTITLCGKLEELTESQRTFYFHSFSNTTFSIFNYPKFNFIYKLVDYCYNITLLEHNSTFVVQPSPRLKCHFKIHLPFGNEIALKLRLKNRNADTTAPTTIRKIYMSYTPLNLNEQHSLLDSNSDEFIELENFSPNSDAKPFINHMNIDCDGVLIEIINRMNEKWSECTKETANVEYQLESPDNILLIRITKRQQLQHILSTKAHNEETQLSLEYTAVPIENIVSQCAFGWILVGQYCISSFNVPLSWENAESACINQGGHLASINNDNEQHQIDMMLLNR